MSEGEAHASHLATQTLANMVIARRAAYPPTDPACPYGPSCREPQAFHRRVPEARVWDAEEDEVDQRKVFLKPSSSVYHKKQTSSKGKGSAVGKSSASASQAKQSKPKPPPQPSKDSGPFKRGGGSSCRGGRRGVGPNSPIGSPPMVVLL